jgi:hypothetical protein
MASLRLDHNERLQLIDVYVVIDGDSLGPGYKYTASDPKLLNYNGHIFLYWTAIKKKDNAWISIATRGAELVMDLKDPPRMWPKGAEQAVSAYDPERNREVWPGADVFSVRDFDGKIYATAGAAHDTCLTPATEQDGCFRLLISKSSNPLADDAFSRDVAPANLLPTTGQEYARFITTPDGEEIILGHFVPHKLRSFKERPVPEGLTAFPIDVKRLFSN